MMWDKELRSLLDRPLIDRALADRASDVKWRLKQAGRYHRVVDAVDNLVFHAAMKERYHVREDEHYAILAFELLKQNVELQDRILTMVNLQPGIIITPKGDAAL